MSEEIKDEAQEKVTDDNVTKVEMKSMSVEDDVYKVDLSQSAETEETSGNEEESTNTEEPTAVVEEVTEEEEQTESTEEEEKPAEETAVEEQTPTLPDNVQKLVDFMEETGGDINDYVKLNRDISSIDDQDALLEFYKSTKPHLNAEDINYLIEERFSYDEELDDDSTVRRKKIAFKEQVAEAKAYLDGQKSKYYEEIKAGSKLTSEQQKAIDFFNRYTKESEENQKRFKQTKNIFNQKTDKVFGDEFKGFEFNVGEKKFRYNVKDVENVKSTQSDINNFVKKFLNEDGNMDDAKGYHKSLFTAMNADAIANHFYEQGKADAMKASVEKGKNINMEPRQQHGEVAVSGVKYKVLDGDGKSDFKVKMKRKK